MLRENGRIRLSASDLVTFTGCAHATQMELDRLNGAAPEPAADSADARLLQRHGDAHEARHLERLRADGGVVEIDRDLGLEAAAEATRHALASGVPVVFQGALAGGMWGGWSDFLERVERPSALGAFSYEVADTKLKRKPAPSHVLQLVLYSDLLTRIQGEEPERAHVLLGDGSRYSLRLAEVAAYAHGARDRLERFMAEPWETRPVPVAGCALCRWRDHCAERWEAEDSLYRVAGIARGQVAKIEAAGIETMAGLAAHAGRIPRLAEPTHERLALQARLQTARADGPPAHTLRPRVPGKGFDLMPPPDPGDLFYDIEGDPFYLEDGVQGLEYLHGIWERDRFHAFWAHDRAEEAVALDRLLALFEERLTAAPGAHIYHYAAYERTALRSLVMRHGRGEALLDRWLREGRFVDLYAVVRNGVAASEPSYSIKDMEALYGFERTGEVKSAGGSVVAYEGWREVGGDAVLDEIEHYNRLDCVSTEALRSWLLSIRPEGPWAAPGQADEDRATGAEAEEAEAAALRERLLAADLPEGRGQLLFDLACYHRREKKPVAWAVFDAAAKDTGDLCEDPDCLGGLVALGAAERVTAKSDERRYRYPPQETKLRPGKGAAVFVPDEPVPVGVTVQALDRAERVVTVRTTRGDILADRLDLLPGWAVGTKPIEAAIRDAVADQLGARTDRAADDLLARRPPRFAGDAPLPVPDDAEPVAATIRAVRAMDGTVLPIQGPPGTGKTYVTARAILALVADGQRVGVCSTAHDAIRNVLVECVDALEQGAASGLRTAEVTIAHKGKEGMAPLGPPHDAIRMTGSDAALRRADIVGGTAWLFSGEAMRGAFDYIFVDEAGQVPLANALALTTATRNLVLVGDPNQLPQVRQGAHPHPADLSCLDWMIAGARTLPPDRGLFLPVTRRMHPGICDYVSRQFYEGRLQAHESTRRQGVAAAGLPASGVWLCPVAHEGRVQDCPEETAAIRDAVARLLAGTMTDREGRTRTLTRADIVVVAPYNVQVNALAAALPGLRVGTVDRFQGQEAQVAIVSMTTSSADETPRGLDFLLSRERMNVAVSRGKALSLVFTSPRLGASPCATVEQMRLVNALAALPRHPAMAHEGEGCPDRTSVEPQ